MSWPGAGSWKRYYAVRRVVWGSGKPQISRKRDLHQNNRHGEKQNRRQSRILNIQQQQQKRQEYSDEVRERKLSLSQQLAQTNNGENEE